MHVRAVDRGEQRVSTQLQLQQALLDTRSANPKHKNDKGDQEGNEGIPDVAEDLGLQDRL